MKLYRQYWTKYVYFNITYQANIMDVRERFNASWRLKMVQIFDVILRVPPLFMMDSILNLTFLHIWPWDPLELPGLGIDLLVVLFFLVLGE